MKLVSVIMIEKNGNLKDVSIKWDENEGYGKLYKKCGFKSPDNFTEQYCWSLHTVDKKNTNVKIFAKTTGRNNLKNKYKFPESISNTLYFGNVCIIASVRLNEKDEPFNFKIKDWELFLKKINSNKNNCLTNQENKRQEQKNNENPKQEEHPYDGEHEQAEDNDEEEEEIETEIEAEEDEEDEAEIETEEDDVESQQEDDHEERDSFIEYCKGKTFQKNDYNYDDYDIENIGTELSEEEYI